MLNLDDLPVDLAKKLTGVCERMFWQSNPEFPRYEQIIGLVNPDERFRGDLAGIVGRYMARAELQAREVDDERATRLSRLQSARERKRETAQTRAKIRSIHDAPGADKRELHDFLMEAFKADLVAEKRLDDVSHEKGKRGRRTKSADRKFVEETWELYPRVAGKRPTIVTNDAGHSGPFVQLIEAVGRDVRKLCREHLGPKVADTLSANLGRLAKSVQMNKKS
jgi:hypothetical protein